MERKNSMGVINAKEVQVGDEVFVIYNNPHVPTVFEISGQRKLFRTPKIPMQLPCS
ncbi:transcriptional regulator SplA domain-containing protein [Peribacillus frigoritolerans]|nr:transcriptional regulator SplA domain-containing protein [Peribacillus frigoritolerans]